MTDGCKPSDGLVDLVTGCRKDNVQCLTVADGYDGFPQHPVKGWFACAGNVTSENPINGKTLHKGPVAHVMRTCIPIFTATRQKHVHTVTKKSLNAPQPRPQHYIKAYQLGSIGALLFMLPDVQCKW